VPTTWNTRRSTAIERFDLEHTAVDGELPPEYAAWTAIERFYVYRTAVGGVLPPEYAAWTSIERFDVSDTAVDGVLPPEYAAWTAIGWFDVSDTAVDGVLPPEYAAWTALSFFDVSSNRLSGVLPDLASNTSLVLDCSHNRFTGSGQMKAKSVDFSHNQLTELPSTWRSHVFEVESLDISSNPLTSWPMAGVHARSAYTESVFICGEKEREDKLLWDTLTTLVVDHCPLGVEARDFLHSVSYLPLVRLSARNSSLHGDLPMEYNILAPVVDHGQSDCSGAGLNPTFSGLQFLDLSANSITAVDAPPPAQLLSARLYENQLHSLPTSW